MPLSTFLNNRHPTRGVLWLALSQTGHVLTRTTASDGAGGTTETYAVGSAIPCRIDPLSDVTAGTSGGRVSELSQFLITVPADTVVRFNDDFRIDGVGDFEITAIRRRTGQYALVIEVTDRR